MGLKQLFFNRIVLILSLLLLSTTIFAQALDSPILPYESVATTEDASSLEFNPAGLSRHPGQMSLSYGWLGNNTGSVFNGFLNLPIISLAYENADFYDLYSSRNIDLNKFSLGFSSDYKKNFSWGLSYSWYSSSLNLYEPLTRFNLGFQYRPFSFLSLGWVLKNLNNPTFAGNKVDTLHILGLGFRPLGDFLTLSYDLELQKNRSSSVSLWESSTIAAKIRLPYNITLKSHYQLEKKEIQFSLAWEESNMRFSFASSNRSFVKGGGSDMQNSGIGVLLSSEEFTNGLPNKKYLELVLSGKIIEKKNNFLLWGSTEYSLFEIVQGLEKAAEDPGIQGLLLRVDSLSAGFAKIQEIRAALKKFQSRGKKIIAFSSSPGNKEYYLISLADKIIIPPAGTVALSGLSFQLYFFKDLLEKIGVEADFVSIGEYKSAMEVLTRQGPSDASNEAMLSLLKDLSNQMITDISNDRKNLSKTKLKTLMDTGFYSAPDSVKNNLIDEMDYYHNIRKKYSRLSLSSISSLVSARSYFKSNGYDRHWGLGSSIAILYISGEIVGGSGSGSGIFSSGKVGSAQITKAVSRIAADRNILGVILRVDSPGGSALASDIIWNSLKQLKKSGKKIVVSFSDTAASGGYYVAVAGDAIVASPGTITGSIGIFGGKFSLKNLYAKLGINKVILKESKNAAVFSEGDKFTDKERRLLKKHMEGFYEIFLKRVSDNRKMNRDEVHKVAKGRVWTGKQALKNGLIDKLGGLSVAISLLKKKLKLPKSYKVEFVHLPKNKSLFFSSGNFMSMLGFSPAIQKAVELTLSRKSLKEKDVLFLMPYEAEIK